MKRHALIILDMMNKFDFPGGEYLYKEALPCAKNILRLKERCYKKKIPIIYVNDNFTKWRSSWEEIWQICANEKSKGANIAHILKPTKEDYLVLKPKHSAFYSTVLELLLKKLKVKKLILTGVAGNICVLFTANDAHMRDYEIIIPPDCIASNSKKDNDFAIRQFKEVLKFKVPLSQNIQFRE